MKLFFILCAALFAFTSGCETREQIMQEREGDKSAGSLESAAYMAEVDNLRRLIAEKADVNVKFKNGGTPLFSAIQRIPAERGNRRLIQRRREAVRVLLEAGADPDVEMNGKRLIATAREGGDIEIDRMLEEASARKTAL